MPHHVAFKHKELDVSVARRLFTEM